MNFYHQKSSKMKSCAEPNSSNNSNDTHNTRLQKTFKNVIIYFINAWLLFFMANNIYSQTLMSFDGAFPNGSNQEGKANYKFYEDPKTREYKIDGPFNYSIVGEGDLLGFAQTISGSYEKGLKNGTWTYRITMKDHKIGAYYHTGTITLVSNYKNGLADGSWTENFKDKVRQLYLTGWGEYEPEQSFTTNMNFSKGKIVGAVNINDNSFTANGSYDQNSYSVGTWKINLIDKNQYLEITYKNNYMTDFIGRNSSGQILDGSTSLYPEENAEDFQRYLDVKEMSLEERENAGFGLDTFCVNRNVATKYIKPYFDNMMSTDWFLYKYIKGDLTYSAYSYKYEIPGGCNIVVKQVNYSRLENFNKYKEAEVYFNSGLYLNAFNSYNDFRKQMKSDNLTIKSADLKKFNEKLEMSFYKADSMSKHLITAKELYPFENVLAKDNYGTKKIDRINESYSNISNLLKNNWKEQVSQILSSFDTQNMEYYRPYKYGAIYSLDEYLNQVWVEEIKFCSGWGGENSKVFFNNKSLNDEKAYANDGVEYCNCHKDSLMAKLTVKMEDCLSEINKALSISKQIESKVNQIEELNLSTKTKLVYTTYAYVLSDFKIRYTQVGNFSENQSMNDYINLITKINLSLDKIMALYKSDEDLKNMDKALKQTEDIKLKHSLLFPLLSFRSDGDLEGLYDN
jgi:hypothetical protein